MTALCPLTGEACVHIDCGFYDEHAERCAIVNISKRMSRIDNNLNRIEGYGLTVMEK